VTCFLPVPVDGSEVKGHGETAKRYQVQIDGSEVSCHDEIVLVRAKNKAPARRPTAPTMLSRQTKLSGCHRI
jgi:hypothetical protein